MKEITYEERSKIILRIFDIIESEQVSLDQDTEDAIWDKLEILLEEYTTGDFQNHN